MTDHIPAIKSFAERLPMTVSDSQTISGAAASARNSVFAAKLAHALGNQAPAQLERNSATLANAPAHIPLAGQSSAQDHDLNERALGLHAYRLQLLASNIANADTPNYKAVDIDVGEALKNGQSVNSKIPLKYHVPQQGSVDGNTVDMDVERVKFIDSTLRYEYSVDRVKGHYKDIEDLLKGTPY